MCTVAESKKKKKFFIRPVNKIIKSLSHLSHSPSHFSLSHSLISSLKTLLGKLLFHHLTPHATDCHTLPIVSSHLISSYLTPPHASRASRLISSRLISSHLTPPIASSHLISSHAADRLLIKPPV